MEREVIKKKGGGVKKEINPAIIFEFINCSTGSERLYKPFTVMHSMELKCHQSPVSLPYLWLSLQTPSLRENTCRKVSFPCHSVAWLGNAKNRCDGVSTPAPSHRGELVGNTSEMCPCVRLLRGRESIAPELARGGLTSDKPQRCEELVSGVNIICKQLSSYCSFRAVLRSKGSLQSVISPITIKIY